MTIYTAPTVATSAPRVESWSEIRCPACVPLGWPSSRLLFRVTGTIRFSGATIEIVCHRCKSRVAWVAGVAELQVLEKGQKNDKARKVAFE